MKSPSFSLGKSLDLGALYDFIGLLEKLCIMDSISKSTNGKQFEINYSYDLNMFSKLVELQVKQKVIYLILFNRLCPELHCRSLLYSKN